MKLLEDSVNGNKIVEKELDKDIKTTNYSEDSLKYGVEIDFEGIISENSNYQTTVINDLLDLRIKNLPNHEETFSDLLTHPVISTFILAKWEKAKWYFYLESFLFILFLICYSAYISILFYRPHVSYKHCHSSEKKLTEKERQNCEINNIDNFEDFLSSEDNDLFFCEVLFLILNCVGISMETYQAYALRRQYFEELENSIQWIVLISALLTVTFKPYLLIIETESHYPAFIRGFASLGILSAWMNLIIIVGRYPIRGGDFSIMFYNIIKIISRYVMNLIFMIAGFAFAFMIVNSKHEKSPFKNAFKSIMTTLTMVLGEFNSADFYDSFGHDVTSRTFGMFLLVLMILFGTLTMVNLFVVVIISDIDKLQNDVNIQNLVNMAQCGILMETLLPSFMMEKLKVDSKMVVCMHTLCNRKCVSTKLPENFNNVKKRIEKICEKKTNQRRGKAHQKIE